MCGKDSVSGEWGEFIILFVRECEFIILFVRECEFIILFAYFVISCAANLIFEVNYT